MNNHGNYIISLGNFCRWLATQAEALGVEIYPGFAAAEVLYDEDGARQGRRHRRHGHRQGRPADRQLTRPASSCTARYTLFAEGCRGSLTKTLFERFKLRDGVDPQTYGIGIKELWEIDPAKHQQGTDHPHHRLAAGPQHLWRLLPLSPGEQPGGGRLRRRARLPESASLARSRSSSASRRTRRSGRSSRAAGASPTARARSTRAASSRSRS